jgi:cytochrome c556
MGAIVDILKNRLPLADHIVDHARSIQQNSKMTLAMFPKGSGLGDTKAKPVIWENWSKFESAVKAFVRESAKLAKVAESGDMEALAKQVRATGKTCGGCHRNFRKRD